MFFGKETYFFYHAIVKEEGHARCGVTIMVKRKVLDRDDERITAKIDESEGRWVMIRMKGLLEKDLTIWGMYLSTKPTERKKWMGEMQERVEKEIKDEEGYKILWAT